jgi:short-subunit dehydrogenase
MKRETAVVTGSSRGIGAGIALRLASEGYNVMLFGRDEKALQKVKGMVEEKNVEAEYFVGGVEDKKFVSESIGKIEEKYGLVNVLINNAGMGIFKNIVDAELEDFKMQVDANMYGIFNFSKAVLKKMIENKNGAIINIASLAGKNSFAGGAMYSGTKHAVLGFTRSMMLEVREFNIRCAAICPGSVSTEFFSSHEAKPDFSKILTVDDVAECVMLILRLPLRALASEIDLRPTNPK